MTAIKKTAAALAFIPLLIITFVALGYIAVVIQDLIDGSISQKIQLQALGAFLIIAIICTIEFVRKHLIGIFIILAIIWLLSHL